jgi:7-carboxy-7-deazaguanine synthase
MNSYPVMESFYTLQGEGVHSGSAAYFIRLAGCDVGCSWCDVKDSWQTEGYPVLTDDELVDRALDSGTEIVVITGGEPLMYNLDSLTAKLQLVGLRTHIETSGAHPFSGSWDWVCVSPKKFKEPLPEVLGHANELKVIVVNKHDFEWGEKYSELVPEQCTRIFQPEWSKSDKVTPAVIDYIRNSPKWRLSLQTHKYLDIP